jgi:hypothetical protein
MSVRAKSQCFPERGTAGSSLHGSQVCRRNRAVCKLQFRRKFTNDGKMYCPSGQVCQDLYAGVSSLGSVVLIAGVCRHTFLARRRPVLHTHKLPTSTRPRRRSAPVSRIRRLAGRTCVAGAARASGCSARNRPVGEGRVPRLISEWEQLSYPRLTDLDEAANGSLSGCRKTRRRPIAKPDWSHDGRFGGGVWKCDFEHAEIVVHLRGIRRIRGGALRRCAAHER